MKRFFRVAFLILVLGIIGFVAVSLFLARSDRKAVTSRLRPEMSAIVSNEISRIRRLFEPFGGVCEQLDVRALTCAEFHARLSARRAGCVTLWMPGDSDWLLVNLPAEKQVPLAGLMERFAEEDCVAPLSALFASYVGELKEVLPAFAALNPAERVLPEFFVTEKVPELEWLDRAEVDADILAPFENALRSAQFVRRLLLKGVIASRAGEVDAAVAEWAKVAKRNPFDSMLRERLSHLWVNAEVFLKVGKAREAATCCEAILAISPGDPLATERLAKCLVLMGRCEEAAALRKMLKK